MAVVYKHKRLDNNRVFYIGIGRDKYRAGKKNNRNKHWHNIVNKHGYTKEIIHDNLSWNEACEFEKFYISLYGRYDMKKGHLVNMTRGGEGCPTNEKEHHDYHTLEELKKIISLTHPRFDNPKP